MTAHPESVVGRVNLAALKEIAATEDDAAFHAARSRYLDAKEEAFPAILIASEEVWAACHAARTSHTHDLSDHDDGVRAMANCIIAILAPLFEKPEKTT